ncbi:MAG: ABC transporter permease [Silvanigrellaceae bacterium]
MKWSGLPAKIWMFLFVLMPFLWLVALSLQESSHSADGMEWGFRHFERALTAPFSGIIYSSVGFSFMASLAVLLIAVPATWHVARLPRERRKIWLALLSIPLGLNFVVRIYAWFVLVRPEGMLTRFLDVVGFGMPLASTQEGVFISLVYGYLPFMFLPLYSVFERFDSTQLDAAIDLGASTWQRWWHIVLPEILPGIVASFVFVFVPMLGEYLIPKMIGGGLVATLGTQIESQFLGSIRPNWPFGAALSLCLLICAVGVLAIALRILSRSSNGGQGTSWSLFQAR